MTPLSLAAPLHSLRLLSGLSHLALGQARGVSDAAVCNAERVGAGIRLETLAAYAEAAGYRLVVGVERVAPGEGNG